MDTFQLRLMSNRSASHIDADLLPSAIAGVLKNAQEGELPLFSWTLGMTQAEFIDMVTKCFPELGKFEPIPELQYAALIDVAPADFLNVRNMLVNFSSPGANEQHIDWLARAIAAACQGSRHLWQDLGLNNRDAVSRLLQQYFAPLYLRNTQNLKWKRFIFAQLGLLQGNLDLRPPKCRQCDEFDVCFPLSGTSGHR